MYTLELTTIQHLTAFKITHSAVYLSYYLIHPNTSLIRTKSTFYPVLSLPCMRINVTGPLHQSLLSFRLVLFSQYWEMAIKDKTNKMKPWTQHQRTLQQGIHVVDKEVNGGRVELDRKLLFPNAGVNRDSVSGQLVVVCLRAFSMILRTTFYRETLKRLILL